MHIRFTWKNKKDQESTPGVDLVMGKRRSKNPQHPEHERVAVLYRMYYANK